MEAHSFTGSGVRDTPSGGLAGAPCATFRPLMGAWSGRSRPFAAGRRGGNVGVMAGVHHASVFVSDLERSVRFYCDLLGVVENGRATLDAVGIEQVFLSAGTQQADVVLARRLDGIAPPNAMRDKRE